jgi:hypothetical protein
MPPLSQSAPEDAFDASILTLQANFSSGLTLLTAASTPSDFLRATDGPFAELKELVAQHTSIEDRPQFQPLVPPDQIVKEIVQKIWGHSSIEAVGGIGDILDKGLITDDLSLEGASVALHCLEYLKAPCSFFRSLHCRLRPEEGEVPPRSHEEIPFTQSH